MQVQALTLQSTAVPIPVCGPLRRRDDIVLTELLDSYSSHGGLVPPEGIISLMRPHWRQPSSTLAKWIAARKVVSFAWRSQLLLPTFQFERPRMTPRQGVAEVALELVELMDDQGVATWFVRPTPWLKQATPLETILFDSDAVVEAARRTRHALIARRCAD